MPAGPDPGCEHFVNADFDLSLRPLWRGHTRRDIERLVHELSLHSLLLADTKDSVVVADVPADDFLESLAVDGLLCPTLTVYPAVRREARLLPFGWNQEAIERNALHDAPVDHPPLDVVRAVNGRRFSAELEASFGDSRVRPEILCSLGELEAALARDDRSGRGWVVKANHGSAGVANRRLRRACLSESDRELVGGWLSEEPCVVLEPWCPRLADLSVTFTIDRGGGAQDLEIHQVINSADGAFIGALFEPQPGLFTPWVADLHRVAEIVAQGLQSRGYFGPTCIDAFIWYDEGRHRLRPLVEINARSHFSKVALRLWRTLGSNVVLYWRLFSRARLQVPDHHRSLRESLGGAAYDQTRRRGVLVTSPLRLGGDAAGRKPHRLGVAFVAERRHEVFEMEAEFRRRYER